MHGALLAKASLDLSPNRTKLSTQQESRIYRTAKASVTSRYLVVKTTLFCWQTNLKSYHVARISTDSSALEPITMFSLAHNLSLAPHRINRSRRQVYSESETFHRLLKLPYWAQEPCPNKKWPCLINNQFQRSNRLLVVQSTLLAWQKTASCILGV